MLGNARLWDIHVFLTLAENQYVDETSSELDIPQKTVFKYIDRIEEDLEVKLFYREKPPYTLTTAGIELVNTIKKPFYRLFEEYNQINFL